MFTIKKILYSLIFIAWDNAYPMQIQSVTNANNVDDSFIDTIADGDYFAIRGFLTNKATIISQDAKDQALWHATYNNRYDLVTLLLEHNACTDCIHPNGFSSLHVAACNGNWEIAKALLTYEADANILETYTALTPLLLAAHYNHYAIVTLLLDANADTTLADKDGIVPLHKAVMEGNSLIAELLLKKNNNVNVKTKAGTTAIFFAADRGDFTLCQLLINAGAQLDATDSNDFMPLHYAAQKGHKACAELLIKHGADILSKGCGGYQPIHFAAQNGHVALLSFLIDLDKETIESQDSTMHATPLHMATRNNYYAAVELLLKRGANPNAKLSNGFTPLLIAATRNFLPIVILLLKYKADITFAGTNGETPLSIAFEHDYYDIITCLIEHGTK